MNDLEISNNTTFERIKHIDEKGREFWYARKLQIALIPNGEDSTK